MRSVVAIAALITLPGCAGSEGPGRDSVAAPGTACNGHDALCERPFDQISFPGTHNSMAAEEDGFGRGANANQVRGVGPQLVAGVRVFLLDVYEEGGERLLCHGPCVLGSVPHLDVLQIVADFLNAHERQVVIFVYQDAAAVGDIVADLETTGLTDLAYAHPADAQWPTLGEMIEADERLVVTLESGGPPPDVVHHLWDVAWDTPYSWTSPDDFDCSHNRGDPANDLLQVNHWLSNDLGLPRADEAAQTNSFDVLHGHASGCLDEADDHPNFVVVDYYEQGDLFAVVDALNGL